MVTAAPHAAMALRFEVTDDIDRSGGTIVPEAAASWRRDGNPRRMIAAGALLLGDAASFLAIWLAMVPLGAAEGLMPRALALVAVVTLALFWAQGLYPGYRLHGYEVLRRRCTVTLRIALVSFVAAFVLSEAWRPALLASLLLMASLAVQPLLRALVRGALRRWGLWGEAAVVLGEPRLAAEVAGYLADHWQYGIRPQAQDGGGAGLALIAGAPPSRREVADLLRSHADVFLIADFPGLPISGLLPAEIGGEIGLRLGGRPRTSRVVSFLHRALDTIAAGILAIVALPLLLLAGVAIYAVDPGPVLYRQTREGLHGRRFEVLKLRTMYRDADARLEAVLAADPEARETWETHFKLPQDPRILPGIGGLLRGASIDELPQLFNVIAGDMRLVGPRPFPIYHLAALDEAFRIRRRSVTPGLTGLWQISERSDADLARQKQLDDFYLENRSFWFDMHVLLKTIPAVVRGDGAY